MGKSVIKKAAAAFIKGEYANALDLYKTAATTLGEHVFKANIILCQNRLTNSRSKTYTHKPLQEIKVACVMDEFTFASYKDICTLKQLSIDQWRLELEQLQPDLLFIESAWRGKDDAWNRKISQASPELLGVLEWCKQRNIPTMFWNKEDPVHFGTFLNTAKRFDYVFTTDLNCISNYKRDLGHDRVYLLPFGCNPVDHNPIEKYQRQPKACFAGSYYVRYPERIRDLDALLETFIEHSGVDIYDRNFGKEDVNYAFPDKYKPLILGNLKYEDIDLAYKGYDYGINLNSVKYSPSMFARRVFELLASRTLVVSNYSQGVRLFFGDLVISTDAKSEIAEKLEKYASDPGYSDQIKQEGLRKVMLEHTYENRFSYIAEKVLGRPQQDYLPLVHVLAIAKSQADIEQTIENFRRQDYSRKKLHIFCTLPGLKLPEPSIPDIELVLGNSITSQWINLDQNDFAAYFNVANYYGPHYLLDLALATKYTNASIITKAEASSNQGGESYKSKGAEYTFCDHYLADASLVSAQNLSGLLTAMADATLGNRKLLTLSNAEVFRVDSHNFLAPNGTNKGNPLSIDIGIQMNSLLKQAESIPAAQTLQVKAGAQPLLQGSQLHKLLNIMSAERRGIACTVQDTGLKITVAADAESPYYIYTNGIHPLEEFWRDLSGKVFLETTPGLELSPVVMFFDHEKNRLNHTILISNRNQLASSPTNAKFCRLGIRVSGGPGQAIVKNWVFDHVSQEHRFNWMPSSDTLVISANYPSYDDYYRYAFVHRRIKGYKEHGLKVDTFRFRQREDLKFYEFEDIDVVSGGNDALSTILRFDHYKTIAIHALDQAMWHAISPHLDKTKIIIWLHGAEIQSWKRRMFNYTTQEETEHARGNGEKRDEFWRSIFNLNHPNIHYIFVSDYFKKEVLSDLGVTCNPANIHIIHNPIDTNLFSYRKKDPEQRKKILSIRPYASRVYANDLMVKAIIELSKRPCFNELHFKIIGDGVLFDETIEPLKKFENVEIFKGFLSQREIANLHKDYGVFLCPSRMDTQGVSRDEAMASGLVPVTNNVGAISEFLPKNDGFMCKPEDYIELANSIDTIFRNPDLFAQMSASAASSIRQNRTSAMISESEIQLLKGKA